MSIRNTILKSSWLMLLSLAWISVAHSQVQFKIELMPDGHTYQVKLKSSTTYTGANALTSTAQVTLVAPAGTVFIQNLTSVHGSWENNTNALAPVENPGFDYFMVGLVSLGTGAIPYVAGEEVVLFTFENSLPCTSNIELMELGDPFTPPNQQKINAGNELFVLGFGNGNAWQGNYGQGSAACTDCIKPIEYSIRLLPDGITYLVSLRTTTDYIGINGLTNSAQVSLVVPTGTFSITNLQNINGEWSHNTLVRAPEENPEQDYFLIGLTTNGTMSIGYQTGVETPLFTFENGGLCSGPVSLMEAGDPFYPPNSLSINAGNEIVLFGFGNENAWCGNYGAPAECPTIDLQARAMLQGPYMAQEQRMHDSLRMKGLLPLEEPYSTLLPIFADEYPYQHIRGGGEKINPLILNITGDNAIVDWVFLELRDPNDSMHVMVTRSALIQRDGDIVDLDGRSPVAFTGVPPGQYHLSVRHRNHLGVMTAQAVEVNTDSPPIDFTDPATITNEAHARAIIDGVHLMWAGDANANGWIGFAGKDNDVDALFIEVLTAPENQEVLVNFILEGYMLCDVNLNGAAIFQGPSNDIAQIFLNVMTHPANQDALLNFIVMSSIH